MFADLIKTALPIALIIIMTGVGLGLTLADFKRVVIQPKAFVVGLVCQMILLPLVAVAVIELMGLTGALAIGLFILSLCPGGATSNLYAVLARGDVGLSISLTTVIGFITPFTIPVLGAWAINHYSGSEQTFSLPLVKTWITLLLVTVVPVIIGMLIRAKWTALAKAAEPWVSGFSILVLAAVILVVCISLGDKFWDFLKQAGLATLMLNLVMMLLGFLVGYLVLHREDQARTISLEIGLQNGTLALLVTSTTLQSMEMSVAPSIYSLVMFFTATLFTLFVRRRAV